jgi:hypothetical protein
LDYTQYINTSSDGFVAQLVNDTNAVLLTYGITQSCDFHSPVAPEMSLVQQIESAAINYIQSQCYESCATQINVGT